MDDFEKSLLTPAVTNQNNHEDNNIYDANHGTSFNLQAPFDLQINAVKTNRKPKKVKDRKPEIIQALHELLSQEDQLNPLTLNGLAKFMGAREATLQKSFASISEVLSEITEEIEQHIFSKINDIENQGDDGMIMLNQMVEMIFISAEENHSFLRILSNEFQFGYERYLSHRLQQLFDRIESSLRQAYRIAAAQGHLQKGEESTKANWLMNYILGALIRYRRNSSKKPSQIWPTHKKSII
jgi:TetR/AcrR family transcriptional regulator